MAEATAARVHLTARSDVLTEVVVLDHLFQLVARGSSPLEIDLPPGAYVVEFKLGANSAEIPVVLREGPAVIVSAPQLGLPSPAPLGSTPAALHYKQFAQAASREVDRRAGDGGELFLFLRTATTDQSRTDIDGLFEVSILDSQRAVVATLADGVRRSPGGFSGGYNLQLSPGSYVMRYTAGAAGPLEQTVVVCDGWQTQVFASSRVYRDDASGVLCPNLPEAALFMAPLGAGFDPEQQTFVITESARQALAEDRALVPEDRVRRATREMNLIRDSTPDAQLRAMLREKFTNPMIGLYSAHLMLLRPERDWELLSQLARNLRTILGDHPDVVALGALPELRAASPPTPQSLPPMLRNSWTLLVAASINESALIPQDSYAAAVSHRMCGTGSWQTWRAPTAADLQQTQVTLADPAAVGPAFDAVLQYVAANVRSQGVAAFTAKVARDTTLSGVERQLLSYFIAVVQHGTKMQNFVQAEGGVFGWLAVQLKQRLSSMTWTDFLTGANILPTVVVDGVSGERVARSLNMPFAAISAGMVSLARKLH